MKTSRIRCICVLLGIVIIAVAGVSGCQEAAAAPPSSDSGGGGPNVGRPEDLASTGASTYPATRQAAVDLFTRSMTSVIASVEASTLSALAVECSPEPFFEGSFNHPINWTGTVGGGTVNMTGSMSGSYREPNTCVPFSSNASYLPLIRNAMALQLSGTMSTVTLQCIGSPTTYYTIVQGRLTNGLNASAAVNAWTNAQGEIATANLNLAYALSYGAALSVRCQGGQYNGMGAKFLVTLVDSITVTDLPLDAESLAAFESQVVASLDTKSAVLRVYNDANTLIGEYTIPLSQLPGGNPIDLLGN